MEIIRGKELSVFKCLDIFLCQAKRENREKVKAMYAVLVLKNKAGGDPVREIKWKDDLGTGVWDILWAHRKEEEPGKYLKDGKGGYVVDMAKLRATCAHPEEDSDEEDIKNTILRAEGGKKVPYVFPTGPRYANDIDGQPTLNKRGERVQKSRITVFVRVEYITINDKGLPETTYIDGRSPEVVGEELMSRFFIEPVGKVAKVETPADGHNNEDSNEETPF